MKWLIYLYPKKWRERYEEEFLYILENRKISLKEMIDVFIGAMDARLLNLVEGMINMYKKIRDIMLVSGSNTFLIIASTICIGMFGGYWIASNSPSILDISPKLLLLIGVALGLFLGYFVGFIKGILRVINVAHKDEIFLPAIKLKFDKSKD